MLRRQKHFGTVTPRQSHTANEEVDSESLSRRSAAAQDAACAIVPADSRDRTAYREA